MILDEVKPYTVEERHDMLMRAGTGAEVTVDLHRFEATLAEVARVCVDNALAEVQYKIGWMRGSVRPPKQALPVSEDMQNG